MSQTVNRLTMPGTMAVAAAFLLALPMVVPTQGASNGPTPGDYYMTSGGKCADLGSEHAGDTHENVHRGPCNASVFQRWTITADPTRSNRFLIEWFSNSGKFWSAENFKPSADHVTFDPRQNNAFQSWVFNLQPDGSYQISNDGNAKCVTLIYAAPVPIFYFLLVIATFIRVYRWFFSRFSKLTGFQWAVQTA